MDGQGTTGAENGIGRQEIPTSRYSRREGNKVRVFTWEAGNLPEITSYVSVLDEGLYAW